MGRVGGSGGCTARGWGRRRRRRRRGRRGRRRSRRRVQGGRGACSRTLCQGRRRAAELHHPLLQQSFDAKFTSTLFKKAGLMVLLVLKQVVLMVPPIQLTSNCTTCFCSTSPLTPNSPPTPSQSTRYKKKLQTWSVY